MARKNTALLFSFFFVFVILLFGCKKDDPDTKYLLGSLAFELPSYSFPGEVFDLEATGISKPGDDSVQYVFSGKYFTPDTIVGKKGTVKVPDSVGTYSLTLTASAEGYATSSINRTTTVIHKHYVSMVRDISLPADSITDPRDGHIYYYKRFGSLDWFVQNANWDGVGLTYKNTPALGHMVGRLYTWNEAVWGQEATEILSEEFSGIGNGPQGVCPPGWSLPTADDWADLASAFSGTPMHFLDPWNGLGQEFSADATVNKEKMWKYHPDNIKTNTTGWNALPAGYAILEGDTFSGFGQTSFWWAACSDGDMGYYRLIHYAMDRFSCATADKNAVYASVRCVRKPDEATQTE